jgi:hypothetical protein
LTGRLGRRHRPLLRYDRCRCGREERGRSHPREVRLSPADFGYGAVADGRPMPIARNQALHDFICSEGAYQRRDRRRRHRSTIGSSRRRSEASTLSGSRRRPSERTTSAARSGAPSWNVTRVERQDVRGRRDRDRRGRRRLGRGSTVARGCGRASPGDAREGDEQAHGHGARPPRPRSSDDAAVRCHAVDAKCVWTVLASRAARAS